MSKLGNSDREGDKAFRVAKQQFPSATLVYKRTIPMYKKEKVTSQIPITISERDPNNTLFELNATYIQTTHSEMVIVQPHKH